MIRINNAFHHIHTLRDAEELIRQKGLTVNRSYETDSEFYVDSVEPMKGYKQISRMSIRKYKHSGELVVVAT